MKKANRILFIDDNLINYFLVSVEFSKKEMEMVPAIRGEEAIRLFRNNPFFDLVITEITLPDIDGFNLLKEIRKLNPIIPVIAQTASFVENLKSKCLNAGFNCFIEKPFTAKQLEKEVNKYVNYMRM